MILQRLYELAQRENLLDDPAVVVKQVACRIDIDRDGNFLGLHDLREKVEKPGRGKSPPKVHMAGGKSLAVPVRPLFVTRPRTGRLPTRLQRERKNPLFFLADTIARVLPVDRLIDEDKREKFASQRGRSGGFCVMRLRS